MTISSCASEIKTNEHLSLMLYFLVIKKKSPDMYFIYFGVCYICATVLNYIIRKSMYYKISKISENIWTTWEQFQAEHMKNKKTSSWNPIFWWSKRIKIYIKKSILKHKNFKLPYFYLFTCNPGKVILKEASS